MDTAESPRREPDQQRRGDARSEPTPIYEQVVREVRQRAPAPAATESPDEGQTSKQAR